MQPWATEAISFHPGKTWAVVPARGGSKGIPDKCSRPVGGVPLLARTVATAKAASTIGRTIVSTDTADLARLATDAGADVPFLRPTELATDTASTIDAVDHLFRNINEGLPEYLVLLQPTSPFVTPDDIDQAFKLFTRDIDAVCSTCESEVNPDWLRRPNDDGYLSPVVTLDQAQHTPRQSMPKTYRLNGGIYWVRTVIFISQCTFLPPRTIPYEMPVERSIDIDTPRDLDYANWLCEKEATP